MTVLHVAAGTGSVKGAAVNANPSSSHNSNPVGQTLNA